MSELDDLRAEVRRLSDRIEITDLFYRFAAGMDGQDWALLESVWSDDAVVDHTATHWGKGVVKELQHGREEVMREMKKGVSRHFVSHHVITNPRIKLDGDRARAHRDQRAEDALIETVVVEFWRPVALLRVHDATLY